MSIELPIDPAFAELPVIACSALRCMRRAPFTARELAEDKPMPIGWQVRLIYTQLSDLEQACRWDVFCPEHSGAADPRPPDTFRLRSADVSCGREGPG